MCAADNTRGIEMNRMKESNSILQKLGEGLKERHDYMKQWYDSRNTTIVDGVKKINEGYEFLRRQANILWNDRCKQQEVMKKRDDDPEDQGNPDPSATREQSPAATSSQIVVFKPSQLESAQGTSSGTVEEIQCLQSLPGTSYVPSTADLALQVVHPITGELLEEGEIISDLSHEHLLALNVTREVDDAEIDKIPVEPETADVENIEEIVFEGESGKSSYVHEDGTEFAPFIEEWLKENVDVIDEHLKNRDTSKNTTDAFSEWRKQFLSKYEKENLHGRILRWMFVKEIHCVAIKREFGIQYFRSLLSISSLPFYDVAALTKLELINRSNFEGATLFERTIKINKNSGWKDESYKPQFPIYK
ncbi:hypothetical protein HanOQP8_Chr02g0072391 [Helianthus annuus]|nr:hypothetical protein HanOQP8_Chr02g0072391 [Helianthus annuus]